MVPTKKTRHTIYQGKKRILKIIRDKKAKTCEWDVLERSLIKELKKQLWAS